MNKIEFLECLEKLLADVPYTERREALNYYEEYFADADKSEEEVIRTLGSPEEVARSIREDLASREVIRLDEIEVVEEKTAGTEASSNADASGYTDAGSVYVEGETKEKKKMEGWQIALIVALVILTSPIWGSVATAVLGAIISIIAAVFALVLALGVAGIVLFVVAMITLGVAIAHIVTSPVASMFALGLAIFLIGLSFLCLIGCWKSITIVIPAFCKGIVYMFRYIFGRKEGAAA